MPCVFVHLSFEWSIGEVGGGEQEPQPGARLDKFLRVRYEAYAVLDGLQVCLLFYTVRRGRLT